MTATARDHATSATPSALSESALARILRGQPVTLTGEQSHALYDVIHARGGFAAIDRNDVAHALGVRPATLMAAYARRHPPATHGTVAAPTARPGRTARAGDTAAHRAGTSGQRSCST